MREKVDRVIEKIIERERNLVFTSQMKDRYRTIKTVEGERVVKEGRERDGYKKLDFYCDIRLYLYIEDGVRKARVVKNRFVDRCSSNWVEVIENPDFGKIVEITRLPEEVIVK